MERRTGIARRGLLIGAAAVAAFAPGRGVRAQAASVTDSAGRAVALPGSVRRVFAAGPPASILLYVVAPEVMVGWTTALQPAEREFVPARYADLPELGRITGRGNTANVEVVLSARPDLVFDYGGVNATFVSLADRVQAQTGIPYALVDARFDAMADAFELLGRIVGKPERGEALARYTRDTLADIDRRIAGIAREARPRVYYGRGPNGLTTGLEGAINVEGLERVGARNVAAEALGRGGLANVSLEQVLLWDPATILTIDAGFHAAVKTDPNWRSVAAVRAGRVFLAPTAPFGWIDFPPSVNRLLGLRWLAGLLYPQLFPEDLRPIASDFYERFYHQRPTEAQLDRLLRDALPRPT